MFFSCVNRPWSSNSLRLSGRLFDMKVYSKDRKHFFPLFYTEDSNKSRPMVAHWSSRERRDALDTECARNLRLNHGISQNVSYRYCIYSFVKQFGCWHFSLLFLVLEGYSVRQCILYSAFVWRSGIRSTTLSRVSPQRINMVGATPYLLSEDVMDVFISGVLCTLHWSWSGAVFCNDF